MLEHDIPGDGGSKQWTLATGRAEGEIARVGARASAAIAR